MREFFVVLRNFLNIVYCFRTTKKFLIDNWSFYTQLSSQRKKSCTSCALQNGLFKRITYSWSDCYRRQNDENCDNSKLMHAKLLARLKLNNIKSWYLSYFYSRPRMDSGTKSVTTSSSFGSGRLKEGVEAAIQTMVGPLVAIPLPRIWWVGR